jgi:hypothetical protein
VANCPELGIVSQGETPEHAEEMIKEAVELWLECAMNQGFVAGCRNAKLPLKSLKSRMPKLRVFSGAELCDLLIKNNALQQFAAIANDLKK